jgi:alpha-tubulin suppressor-like RCC1 family protein
VSAGDSHTCIVLQNGEARCTGANGQGQRGDTSQIDSARPIPVFEMTQATGISAGGFHSCAVMTDHTVMCWGQNVTGQLGNGTTDLALTPVTVSGITTATAVAAGYRHTCALLQDGRVQCWGDNSRGQLGDGTGGADPSSSTVPVTVAGITNAVAVTASTGYHSCAVLADGSARCWGENGSGQLGDGTRNAASTPVAVSGIGTAVAISGGSFHTCALLQGGAVNCWGLNWTGQLGDGTGFDSNTPVPVSGIDNAVSVDAGVVHSCAALADGTARCWGENSNGQIGNGTTANANAPAAVSGITSALSITAGYNDSCALLARAVVRCWGLNTYGELGDGTNADVSTPRTVTDISPEWSISGSSIATIDDAGLATGVSQGSAIVQVAFDFAPDPRAPRGPSNRKFGSTKITVTGAERRTLTVVRDGTGSGTVTSSSAGIDCGATCAADFDLGAAVTLTAAPASDSVLSDWSGCDTVSGTTCSVTMNATRSVTATFTRPVLTVTMLGTGQNGRVTSADSSITCETPSTSCSASYANGTMVTLTAEEGPGTMFTGWLFCDSRSNFTCNVTMNGSRTVAAPFHPRRYTLWVEMTPGTGGGTISGRSENSSGSIYCIRAACSAEWDYGSRLILTAIPNNGWTFVGWTDGCESVSCTTCTLTITQGTTVRAQFAQPKVVAPAFSVSGGTYNQPQSVALSTTTSGATIHYTTDGSTPTGASPTYTGPIAITQTTTLKAVAMASGMLDSDVSSATFTLQAAAPTFDPPGGSYLLPQRISISDASPGTTIYYTTDGTTPTTSSRRYTSPILILLTTTIKAIAVADGWSQSPVASAQYKTLIP